MQRLALHQSTNLAALERRDPGQPRVRAQRLHRRLPDHAPIAHQDHLIEPEVLLQSQHLGHECGRIGDVSLIHRHRHRAAAPVGEQPVIDLQLAALAIAVVAELGERTLRALEVARGQVVERQCARAQVARRELLLDAALTCEQPVHRRVQIVLVAVHDAKVLGQRRGVPPARGRELGVRGEHPCGHHGAHALPLGLGTCAQKLREAEPLHGYTQSLDVTVGT